MMLCTLTGGGGVGRICVCECVCVGGRGLVAVGLSVETEDNLRPHGTLIYFPTPPFNLCGAIPQFSTNASLMLPV